MPGMLNPIQSVQKMEIRLFQLPQNRQREKIIHDAFASGCFGSASCAKNCDSSELRPMVAFLVSEWLL
jgi:hypothetical protein